MPVRVVRHDHATGVARDPPAVFRGKMLAVLQDHLARLIGIGEHRGVDVNDHLVPRA